ncbi:glycerophosphoryl diester phosphodiesterase [Ereboglobus luteus]|uniref:Glycerophosphoryl diester phosphodiesterase n=2 Tax=Ereboglobus luteus TaxID=1796921 RepID=A0A2U8E3K0_9BACT|nr:glycerophosphoryl diester phosphodiesterase [Ereboglobus luteus]
MKTNRLITAGIFAAQIFMFATTNAAASDEATLSSPAARLQWRQSSDGWKLGGVDVLGDVAEGKGIPLGEPSGQYRILYSETEPDKTPVPFSLSDRTDVFPEPIYKYPVPRWAKATIPAALNLVGEERVFYPSAMESCADGSLVFRHRTDVADVVARWKIDASFPGDVCVELTLTARKDGWFSLPTPTLATVAPRDLKWAVVPGYFKGDRFNRDFPLAFAYGHGLPDRPVIANEGAASTLASIITNKAGATLAVIAEPGVVDPYSANAATREIWRIGLSHMNRAGELTPTLYRALLGSRDSRLEAGQSLTFSFRYSLRADDWFAAIKHAAEDIYRVHDFLALKKPVRSLSQRLHSLHEYVTDDATSLWHTEEFGGMTIGAQAYNGGVVGARRDPKIKGDYDAMKNSDYGAMWMLARLTNDPRLVRDRLPYARNFKLVQQQSAPGFFQGAALGQYYLAKSRRFVEEWGDYVEPVAITYYTMLDIGNILLFEPGDAELRERLRLGAERLLEWQRADGSWAVAYDHATHKELFTELPDARATFYGLIVAYRILGDEKYLAAARRGADWMIKNAVTPARFLGVCGDARFAPDFATVQAAQAFLDLFDITGDVRYREASIETARQYVTDVFTQPLATNAKKTHKKNTLADWQINQTGLAFEHGGTIGTASGSGPILLASYAGLFIRMAGITGEPLFRDLARAAVLGRDAFLHPKTQAATYYWLHVNAGPGSFPHHAWWQFGWITDYLVSEVELRSAGGIAFPRGFLTPKVGPHACFGFAPGKLYGEAVNLAWGNVDTGTPEVDYIVARGANGARTHVVLLNNSARPVKTTVKAPPSAFVGVKASAWKSATIRTSPDRMAKLDTAQSEWSVEIATYGLAVLSLDAE